MQSMVAVPLKYGTLSLQTISKKPYQGSFYNDMAFVILSTPFQYTEQFHGIIVPGLDIGEFWYNPGTDLSFLETGRQSKFNSFKAQLPRPFHGLVQ